MTKAQLIEKANLKLWDMRKAEIQHFIDSVNCCPHKKTHKVGMDAVCDDCGDWV